MKPSMLMSTLESLIKVRRSTLIEGSPGLGKTQIVKQAADKLGIGFVHIHAPLMQPEDYGMPVVTADRTAVNFVVPAKFPMAGGDHPEEGVLLIDELPQADNAGQKILANLIQERELHGKKLLPGWTVVATGNKATDRAGANRILSHLRNRVTTLEFEPNLDDWCEWALNNGVDINVVSFLRFKPALLNAFDPQQEISPTPRSWVEGVSAILGQVPEKAEHECVKGAVGEGAAAEFAAYIRIARKLPNPDTILLNPDKAEVPTDPATLYALSGAMAHRSTANNFDRVMQYAKRMPPEFMVLVVRDAAKLDPSITSTKAFTSWAMSEGAKVLM